MASAKNVRFGNINQDDIKQKEKDFKNINSLKNEKKAVDAFTAYLKHLDLDDFDFFTFSEADLNKHLSTFWWNARTQKGEKYKASSLETLRHGLKRAILNSGRKLDITCKTNDNLIESQKAFELALKDLKKEGKGYISHRKEILLEGK